MSETTPLEVLEEKCKAAVVFINADGVLETISPNIIRPEFTIVVLLTDGPQVYLCTVKKLCREDLPSESQKRKRGLNEP